MRWRVPGCEDDADLPGFGLTRAVWRKPGGDHRAAQLDQHVLEGRLGLGPVPGLAARRSPTSAGAVALPCVPDDDQGVHEQGEREGALDGVAAAQVVLGDGQPEAPGPHALSTESQGSGYLTAAADTLRAEAERSYATLSSAEKPDGAGAPKGHFVTIGLKRVGMLE